MTTQRNQHQVNAKGMRGAVLWCMVYGTNKLRNIRKCKYLGRILSHDNNYVPAMRWNLKRARGTWKRIFKILTREEIPAPVVGMFFQAVVVAILFYGSES